MIGLEYNINHAIGEIYDLMMRFLLLSYIMWINNIVFITTIISCTCDAYQKPTIGRSRPHRNICAYGQTGHTIQIVLVIVAVKGWKMKQMDMHNTFLHVVGLQSFL
jgi:hypothetical protein